MSQADKQQMPAGSDSSIFKPNIVNIE